eukprot:maker-scaffold340_size202118-snap-gene-1.22 protein:Tk00677 transcript:maker-scaffold340_size202118-snap-gene-1.22-mRNA-1 annotation:"hypothetical protein A1O7_05500"
MSLFILLMSFNLVAFLWFMIENGIWDNIFIKAIITEQSLRKRNKGNVISTSAHFTGCLMQIMTGVLCILVVNGLGGDIGATLTPYLNVMFVSVVQLAQILVIPGVRRSLSICRSRSEVEPSRVKVQPCMEVLEVPNIVLDEKNILTQVLRLEVPLKFHLASMENVGNHILSQILPIDSLRSVNPAMLFPEFPQLGGDVRNLFRIFTEALGASFILYFVYGKLHKKPKAKQPKAKLKTTTSSIGISCHLAEEEIPPPEEKTSENVSPTALVTPNEAEEDAEVVEKAIQDFFKLSTVSQLHTGPTPIVVTSSQGTQWEPVFLGVDTTTQTSEPADDTGAWLAMSEERDNWRALARDLEEQVQAMDLIVIQEKSKSELIRQEAQNHIDILQIKTEQSKEELLEAQSDLRLSQEEFQHQRETFQKTLRALKASLDEREAQVNELEESNALLRQDLVDVVTQFQNEQSQVEKKVFQYRDRIDDLSEGLTDKSRLVSQLEEELSESRCQVDRKRKEKKKLSKEIGFLTNELDKIQRDHDKAKKMSRILKHIENID